MKILKFLLVFLAYFFVIAIAVILIYLSIRNLFLHSGFADSINFSTTPESEISVRSALISIFTVFLPFNLFIRVLIFILRKLLKKTDASEIMHLFSSFFATLLVLLIAQPFIHSDPQNTFFNSIVSFNQFSDFFRIALYMLVGSLILTIGNFLIKFTRSFG